tara:strand:+ start:183 stop:368 length:186 start_codon:yes stop_codon:yes gene_type:complete
METIEEPLTEQSESIKLTKNSRGYAWTIRVHIRESDEITLERLKQLENKIRLIYGEGLLNE